MTAQLRRVTIYDADAELARALSRLLEEEGFEARVTADPDTFVDWARSWLPALSFVDTVGDGAHAADILERLAQAHSRAGIVLMSGAKRGGIRAAREVGTARGLVHAGILRKPFDKEHVVAALARNPHTLESVERAADPLVGWTEQQLAHALQQAITHHELRVVFQPCVALATGEVVGFEALARWDHPDLGQIPPATFIPYAAGLGLMRPITQAVTSHALEWLAASRPQTRERICLNVSAAQLHDEDQLAQVRAECAHHGIPPERVALEVSHTSALADDPATLAALRALDADGFHLVIDDFGTGYSTAARLAMLPFREIKLDTRLVRRCQLSKDAQAQIEAMVLTARDLELECSAEGVESQQILDRLAAWGCDYAQGYYIARPMPADEVEAWLSAQVSAR